MSNGNEIVSQNPNQMAPVLTRRQMIAGVTGVGIATAAAGIIGAPVAIANGQTMTTTIGTNYDQRNYRFSAVRFDCESPRARWQRRTVAGAKWRDLNTTGASLTFTPTWRDIGAEFRAVGPDRRALTHCRLAFPALVGLDPAAYGAVGDGLADDTAALNQAAAAAAAQQTGVDLHGRTYLVTSRINLTNGVTAVFGGTLRQSGTTPSPLYFEGKAEGRPSNVSGCVISDVTIELAPINTAVGIGSASASHIAIIGCTISNPACPGTGIGLRYHVNGGENTTDVVIRDNHITLQDDVGVSIAMRPPIDLKGLATEPIYWRTYWDTPAKLYTLTYIDVIGNTIRGGYYGIAGAAIDDFTIESNVSTMNTRNISLQDGCLRGVVRNNTLSDSISSSIHLAYGSSDNLITGNIITTSRGRGEGLLQAYVGTVGNTFAGNTTEATSTPGPKWHIYTGIHANDNVFENNTLTGTCSRAYIAVEAAWDSTNTHLPHRATGLPSVDNFANADTVNVQIRNNELDPTSSVEYICLADITDANGTFEVVNPVISGNHLQGSTASITPHQYVG